MHYYQVPRLGSYLAIKLQYDSCEFEAAFDAALANYAQVQEKIREQQLEKAEWEAQQAELELEMEAEGEEFKRETRAWPTFSYAPFKT